MMLFEITYPEDALDADIRATIAAELAAGMTGSDMEEPPGPESTMRRGRAMTHVVFHPAQGWAAGDGPLPDDRAPPYLVTLTVPDAWRAEIAEHAIGLVVGFSSTGCRGAYARQHGIEPTPAQPAPVRAAHAGAVT